LLLTLIAAAWVTVSRNPYAQGVRMIFGRSADQPIIDRTFTIGPRGFRFYKFSLPEGSANMAVVGRFSVSADGADDDVEVLVLSEGQFNRWQTGAPAQPIYESGKSTQAGVQSNLPAGGATYFLVFSNKAATAGTKKVTASFALRHRNWWR
jgi:hypothetical protein